MTNRCAATVYFCDVRVRLRTKSYYSGEVSFQVSNRYGDSQTKRISTDCPHCYSHIFNKHSNKAKTLKREKIAFGLDETVYHTYALTFSAKVKTIQTSVLTKCNSLLHVIVSPTKQASAVCLDVLNGRMTDHSATTSGGLR